MFPVFLTLGNLRTWYVPEIHIWGTTSWGQFDMLMVENVEGQRSVMYHTVDIGGVTQVLRFADLCDFRGNHLPESIVNPRIIICSRSAYNAFLIGRESGESFRVARDVRAPEPIMVDLLVLEMGA